MFILFGYRQNWLEHTPKIEIYGIYDSHEKCVSRADELCNCTTQVDQFTKNVIRGDEYVFWWKDIGKLGDLCVRVNNS